MVDEEDKKDEDKVEFDSAGEVIGYISLEQARVLVLRHARENTDFYGRRYARRDLTWEVVGEEEGEDYYFLRLSYRPESGFRGEPGIEQFTIDKAGPIELREIVQRPREERGVRLLLIAGGVLVLTGVIVGVLFATGMIPPEPDTKPEAAAPTFPITVGVPIAPDVPAQLVSPQGEVTVNLAAGSVEDPSEVYFHKLE